MAVGEEDYQLAATLRDRIRSLTEALPPRKQLLLSVLERLAAAEGEQGLERKAAAVRALGALRRAAEREEHGRGAA